MSASDSDLSTPPATDDEMPVEAPPAKATKVPQKKKKKNGLIVNYFAKEDRPPTPSPRKKRAPSPPHEPVPEDNFDIAFLVMFRSRFSDAFPSKCPHLGPQDLERGVIGDLPSSEVESLLCALLGLVNNRKKPVEKGQYGRALEEAIQTQKHQWPSSWNHINPLHGGRSFNTMPPTERLRLLKALAEWSLNQSEIIKPIIRDAYKSRSTKDRFDTNIPLSVQPWGNDGDKRRYWLVQGLDDTPFRVYRESNPALKHVHWWSVAGSIDELRALATKLNDEDGHRDAKALSIRITNAIPMFEATEEKRRKRAYRLERKNKLERPPLYTGLYEGRTRGKRMRYTFDDGEDEDSESGVRRSTRNSGRESSAAPGAGAGPTVTSSGRQVRSRNTGMYGESLLSGQTTDHASPATGDYVRSDASEEPERPEHGRATRAANRGAAVAAGKKRAFGEYDDGSDGEEDATSWNGDDEDDDEPDDQMDVDVDLEEEDFSAADDEPEPTDADAEQEQEQEPHLIVRLKVPTRSLGATNSIPSSPPIPAITSNPDPTSNMDAARPQPVLASAPPPQTSIPPPVAPPASLIESVPALPVPEAPLEFNALAGGADLVNGGPVQALNGAVQASNGAIQAVEPVVVPGKGVEGLKGVVVTKGA